MSTHAIGFHLCSDGPLRGEYHERGPRFLFDGRATGSESGVYVLENGEYRWHAESRARSEARGRSIVLVQSSYRTNLFASSPADRAYNRPAAPTVRQNSIRQAGEKLSEPLQAVDAGAVEQEAVSSLVDVADSGA